MDHEPVSILTTAEQEPPHGFDQSIRQLLGLVAAYGQIAEPHYYEAAWNSSEPTQLEAVRLMTATATGARKQELFGQFHQAQFRVVQNPHTENEKHSFMWASVKPWQTDTNTRPGWQAVYEQYRYLPLDAENVVNTLLGQANSLGDYLTLNARILEHGLAVTPEMKTDVRRLIGQFVRGQIELAPDTSHSQESILELIISYKSVGAGLPSWAQGRLTSVLLQELSRASSDSSAFTARAAEMLRIALNEGVIAKSTETMQRILSSPEIYQHPFATDLLHEYLHQPFRNRWPHSLFRLDRALFALEYIENLVPGIPTQPDITRTPGLRHTRAERIMFESALFTALNTLAAQIGEPTEDRPPAAENLSAVGETLRYVLRRLPSFQAPDTSPGSDFIEKCVGVVEDILRPLIAYKLEGGPVQDATEEVLAELSEELEEDEQEL